MADTDNRFTIVTTETIDINDVVDGASEQTGSYNKSELLNELIRVNGGPESDLGRIIASGRVPAGTRLTIPGDLPGLTRREWFDTHGLWNDEGGRLYGDARIEGAERPNGTGDYATVRFSEAGGKDGLTSIIGASNLSRTKMIDAIAAYNGISTVAVTAILNGSRNLNENTLLRIPLVDPFTGERITYNADAVESSGATIRIPGVTGSETALPARAEALTDTTPMRQAGFTTRDRDAVDTGGAAPVGNEATRDATLMTSAQAYAAARQRLEAAVTDANTTITDTAARAQFLGFLRDCTKTQGGGLGMPAATYINPETNSLTNERYSQYVTTLGKERVDAAIEAMREATSTRAAVDRELRTAGVTEQAERTAILDQIRDRIHALPANATPAQINGVIVQALNQHEGLGTRVAESASAPTARPNSRSGNDGIAEMQTLLFMLGKNEQTLQSGEPNVDGLYGPLTKAALESAGQRAPEPISGYGVPDGLDLATVNQALRDQLNALIASTPNAVAERIEAMASSNGLNRNETRSLEAMLETIAERAGVTDFDASKITFNGELGAEELAEIQKIRAKLGGEIAGVVDVVDTAAEAATVLAAAVRPRSTGGTATSP